MWQSLRYGLRVIRKSPGFAAVAVLTLAIGIGANTAIFSVVNALLLRSLPLEQPDRLVYLSAVNPARNITGGGFSVAAFENLRDGNHSFTGIAAWCGDGFTMTGAGEPEQLSAARVAPNFLDVLGARPFLGRGFQPSEGVDGARTVALISHALWERRFGSDQNILGKTITLDQDLYTIIGVMPADFPFPFPNTDVWVTRVMDFGGFQPEQIRAGAGYLTATARLRPGVTVSQAEAEVSVLSQHYRQEHPRAPDADPHGRLSVVQLQESLVTGIRSTLLILMGAVGLVLLIACANVASLMLARATGRAKEIAIRSALGAGRGTLVRQLLVESLLLATTAAVMGSLLARWGVAWLVRVDAGNNLPGFQPIRVDLGVLTFTLGISLITGIVFGLAPALQASRPNLIAVLRDSGWGTTGGAGRHRTRSLLVAAQMALSIVLLIGAGLLIKSFRNLQAIDPGFDPHHSLTMNVNPPPTQFPDGPRRAQLYHQLVDRLAAMPGVRSANASASRPMGLRVMSPILADGQPNVPPGQRPLAVWNGVTPGYFQTFGVPLLRGRDFTWADDDKAPRVVIVSQALAHHFWPNEDALGKHLTFTRFQAPFEIVGIAGDTRTYGLQSDPGNVMYTSYAQWTFTGMALTIRTEGDPTRFAKQAIAQVQAVDPNLPVTGVLTMDEMMGTLVSQPRQTMFLIAGFAGVSLLLAVIGLYGVMAYAVAQRTTEIGIRQAIGAQRSDILRLVFGQAIRLSLAGIAAGAVAALLLTRLIGRILYHVGATDPLTFGAVALLFLLVAMAASYIPAWRATRVDPLEALRSR
jgi:putative ABC transport system permease protein